MVVTSLLSVVVVIYLLSLVLETFLLSQMVANKVMSVVLVKYSLSVGRGGSGGYRALFRFELPACYPSNLGIFFDFF